jgi:hypothetical protein
MERGYHAAFCLAVSAFLRALFLPHTLMVVLSGPDVQASFLLLTAERMRFRGTKQCR